MLRKPTGGETRSIASLLVLLISFSALAQTRPQQDWELIANRTFQTDAEFAQYRRPGNDSKAISYRRKSWIARYNPVSLTLKGAMLGYQKLVSQQLARSCPYQISCSNFSKQAIAEYGVFKGVFLSADRLTRCTRIGLLDVRPVDMDEVDGSIIDSLSRYR